MRDRVAARGWANIEVGSAGLAAGIGEPAAENAIAVAREAGLDLGSHGARLLTHDLVDWADLILAMSPSHLHGVQALGGGARAALVTDFDGDPGSRGQPVEDPFGSNLDTYRRTFQRLEAAIESVLDRLEPIVAP